MTLKTVHAGVLSVVQRLRSDTSGLAMIEFAATLPFFAAITIGSVELANYGFTVMKLNQIATHVADNAARIGDGTQLSLRKINERNINDVLAGGLHEGAKIKITETYQIPSRVVGAPAGATETVGRTRIIISSVEESATAGKFKIGWQRCGGTGTHFPSSYGTVATTTAVDGVGPTGRQVVAPPGGATIFVEIKHRYTPIFTSAYSTVGATVLTAIASMPVRDRRDFTQVYPITGVTASTCV